jgi:hypothetical protein
MTAPDPDPRAVALAHGVEAGLRALVGLPLGHVGVSATLLDLGFGPLRWVGTGHRGKERQCHAYALHTETPWRIVGPAGMVTGKADLWRTRDGELDFEGGRTQRYGDTLHACRVEEEMGVLLESGAFLVESASVDALGGARIDLARGYRVEVFPMGSAPEGEIWRLFRPGQDCPHLVVTARGMETS